MPRVIVCPLRRLRPGDRRLVEAGGEAIAVFNVEGRIHAVQNRCPHAGASLHRAGCIRGAELVCGWHDVAFSLQSGTSDSGYSIRTYPAGVDEDGNVYVEL